LPIEFVRQSTNGCLTLVIDPASAAIPVLWAPLQVADLTSAVEALRERERAPVERVIGRWPSKNSYAFDDVIGQWAEAHELDGVVWTALGPRFGGNRGQRPSQIEAIQYLRSLLRWKRTLAEAYICRAPRQIDTPYRRAIEVALG
jgi:hypothetical protein